MSARYEDLPSVEMRPLHSRGLVARNGTSGASPRRSPAALARVPPPVGLEEVSLEDFQEEHHLIRRNVPEIEQTYSSNEYVITPTGCVFVEIIGDRNKTPILTYHDIGMNHGSSFRNFFFSSDMMPLSDHFCIYHVDAPGQEEGAPRLPPDFVYPTMDELADQVQCVVQHFRLSRVIGLGSGAGANVLARFALANPDSVQALVLVNPTGGASGWIEWGYQKLNARFLKKQGIGEFSFDYLLWHYFGRKSAERHVDLTEDVRENLGNMEGYNLALFIDTYTKRTNLGLNSRSTGFFGSPATEPITLRCKTMLLVGDDSPHLDDVTDVNAGLDPGRTTFVKIGDCGGLVLEEQPEKAAEAVRLFLQGMGYVPLLKPTRLAPSGIPMARCQSAYSLLTKNGQRVVAQSTLSLSDS